MLGSVGWHAHPCPTKSPVPTMNESVLVAIARFPDRSHVIEDLARVDEEFRSLCTDLAEAEAAMVR